MAFGDTLSNLYQAASDASKAAFNKAAKTTKEAANALEHGYEYSKEKTGQAYEYSKEKVGQSYDYGKEKAGQSYDYSKEKAGQAYDYSKEKAGQAYDYSKEKAGQSYGYGKEKVSQAYDYGKEEASQAYDYGKEKTHEAYDYGKEKAKQAKDYAVKKYDDTKKSVKQQITDAKNAAQKAAIKPPPAGSATVNCPLNEQEKYKFKQDELHSIAAKEDYTDIKPQAKAEIAIKIEKKLQDESYMLWGDKDNNIQIGHIEEKIADSLSYNPLENEHELSLFKREKKFTTIEANVGNYEDEEKPEHKLLEAKAHIEALSWQRNIDPLSGSYSKGNASIKSEIGAEANLIKGSAEGKVNITPKTIYDNTVGAAIDIFTSSYSKAPDWLDHGVVIGAGGEAGIGAAVKASAKGQIGKSGASLELEAKAGFGPMAGLKLLLGVK
jgi:hypothetical protein